MTNIKTVHEEKLQEATQVLWEALGLKLGGDVSVPDTETMRMYNRCRTNLRKDFTEIARKVLLAYLNSNAMHYQYYTEQDND